MSIWCIKKGVLHATNNGFDKDESLLYHFLNFSKI